LVKYLSEREHNTTSRTGGVANKELSKPLNSATAPVGTASKTVANSLGVTGKLNFPGILQMYIHTSSLKRVHTNVILLSCQF